MVSDGIEKRAAAEALGSFFFAAIAIGSGIMAERLGAGDIAMALLAHSLAAAAGLAALTLIFAPVSGAHFNPAVSLAFCLSGELTLRDGVYYAAAQIGGALAGAMTAHLIYGMDFVQNATQIRWGAGYWAGEALAAAMLTLIFLACARGRPAHLPYAIGLTAFANCWAVSSTGLANPAQTIARTITNSFTAIRMEDAALFIVMQLAAAAAAAFLARRLFAAPPGSDDADV